jgi:uncharacterized membrane protein YecN with MAPEG domain
MAGVAIVVALALLEYSVFVWLCGQARGRYDVAAPSTTGNTTYERYYRVQMNSVEQLVMFVPGMWLFGTYVSTTWAMGLGVLFIIGRALYARAYLSENPGNRGPGFLLTLAPNLILLWGSLIGAVLAL